jgi:hypothetical protein
MDAIPKQIEDASPFWCRALPVDVVCHFVNESTKMLMGHHVGKLTVLGE